MANSPPNSYLSAGGRRYVRQGTGNWVLAPIIRHGRTNARREIRPFSAITSMTPSPKRNNNKNKSAATSKKRKTPARSGGGCKSPVCKKKKNNNNNKSPRRSPRVTAAFRGRAGKQVAAARAMTGAPPVRFYK